MVTMASPQAGETSANDDSGATIYLVAMLIQTIDQTKSTVRFTQVMSGYDTCT
jgi:hypothetical protein